MEIELKYIGNTYEDVDKAYNDFELKKYKDIESCETIEMNAKYYDTKSLDLSKEKIALRVRSENNIKVATLKWGETSGNGLYQREEINIPVSDEEAKNISIETFKECSLYEMLQKLTQGENITDVVNMSFIRKQVRIDTEKFMAMLSVDTGTIVAGNKEEELFEIEIEFYSGSEEAMEEFGENLREKYNLQPGLKSKFRRGLDLY